MYNLLENKHKSSADFRAFLTYMINERSYLQGMPEKEREDFIYHYDKLPQYFEQFMEKYQTDILRSIVNIQISASHIEKAIKSEAQYENN